MKQITRQELDGIVSFLAHEIKAPNNMVGHFVGRLLDGKYEGELTVDQKAALLIILQESQRIQNRVNILSTYVGLDSGNVQLQLKSSNLHSLTNQAISSHNLEAITKNIQIINYIPQDYNIYVDPELLDVVFTNLISNAVKYSNRSSEVPIQFDEDKDYAKVSIKNEGYVIPEDAKQNLFLRYYRLPNHVEDRSKKGMGLGLYISKKIIELHKGTIDVETIEKENIFKFSLYKNLKQEELSNKTE